MSRMDRIKSLFISTYPPEPCGLATFTKDLADAVDLAARGPLSRMLAIQKNGIYFLYDKRVIYVVDNRKSGSYLEAAAVANRSDCDIVSIQHEFGLYPGEWGNAILDFARWVKKPLVTTLHTLSAHPEAQAKEIILELCSLSAAVVVMTNISARLLLGSAYGARPERLEVIPHGVPVVKWEHKGMLKKRLGVAGRKVILTFGLINPGKGIEYMIEAMPEILKVYPEALYLIVGRTHPAVKQAQGEKYREQLLHQIKKLNLRSSVFFVDRYVSLQELLQYLQAADVYVTPYLGRDQVASGTLAYALSAGKAIVSTPYLYAEEVLGDGRGVLVDFQESRALSRAIIQIFSDVALKESLETRALEYSRQMQWPVVGMSYLKLFSEVVGERMSPEIPEALEVGSGALSKKGKPGASPVPH